MSRDKAGMKCHRLDEHLHTMEMMTSIWIEQKGEFSVTAAPNKVHQTKVIYAALQPHNPVLQRKWRLCY